MKSLVTFASTAAALSAALVASGYSEFDAPVIVSLGIAALFVADYGRQTMRELDPVKAPVRRARAARPADTSPVFASLVVFNTTLA